MHWAHKKLPFGTWSEWSNHPYTQHAKKKQAIPTTIKKQVGWLLNMPSYWNLLLLESIDASIKGQTPKQWFRCSRCKNAAREQIQVWPVRCHRDDLRNKCTWFWRIISHFLYFGTWHPSGGSVSGWYSSFDDYFCIVSGVVWLTLKSLMSDTHTPISRKWGEEKTTRPKASYVPRISVEWTILIELV